MAPITLLNSGRRLLVRCVEELSEGTVPLLERQLVEHLKGARSVVLDLSSVPFANSEGLRWLLRLDDGLRAQAKPLRVCVRAGSRVDRALSLTGYNQRVEVHHSARDAWR